MTSQRHFRFRADAGAADATPTWGGNEDSNTFSPGASAFRLRLSIENPTHTATGSLPYQIYLSKNGGAYAAITTSSTNGIKSADAGSDADNTSIFIPRLTVPTWTALAGSAIDLDFASDQIYPSGAFTDYLSCSRASIGYAKNSNGTLTQFSSNGLRITDLGLLVEDARTNLCPFSQTIDTATGTWVRIGAPETTLNAAIAPDGTTTATKLVADSSSDAHCVYRGATTAAPTSMSIYMKAAGYNYGFLQFIELVDAPTRSSINVDLTSAAVTSTHTIGSPTAITYSTELLANGWVRLIINSTASASIIVFGISNSASPTYSYASPIFTGDDTSGIYVWGAQVEQAAFASSYIPTTTTSATRAADVITNTSTLQTDIAAATGSIVAQIDNGLVAGIATNIVDSNGANLIGFDSSDHGLASITATLATGNTANRTMQDKLGLAWNASGRSLVLNGGTVATDSSAQTPSSTQHIGSSGAGNFAFAYIKRLTVWTSKLADATLQGHTT